MGLLILDRIKVVITRPYFFIFDIVMAIVLCSLFYAFIPRNGIYTQKNMELINNSSIALVLGIIIVTIFSYICFKKRGYVSIDYFEFENT